MSIITPAGIAATALAAAPAATPPAPPPADTKPKAGEFVVATDNKPSASLERLLGKLAKFAEQLSRTNQLQKQMEAEIETGGAASTTLLRQLNASKVLMSMHQSQIKTSIEKIPPQELRDKIDKINKIQEAIVESGGVFGEVVSPQSDDPILQIGKLNGKILARALHTISSHTILFERQAETTRALEQQIETELETGGKYSKTLLKELTASKLLQGLYREEQAHGKDNAKFSLEVFELLNKQANKPDQK